MKNQPRIEGRPGESLEPFDFDALEKELTDKYGKHIRDVDVMSSALYPKVFDEYQTFRQEFGPVDCMDTRLFLVGPNIAEEFDVRFVIILMFFKCEDNNQLHLTVKVAILPNYHWV